MNLRTTIFLGILAALGAGAWLAGPMLVARFSSRTANPNGAGSVDVLDQHLTAANMQRIEVQTGGDPVVLEKGKDGAWSLPGKWPTRRGEAQELVDLLTRLRSRFQVIPISLSEGDRKPYGLELSQHPLTVVIQADAEAPIRLVFGEPEQTEGGAFAKPTYVQINDKPEVVRLAPNILPVLKRPREYYQRRQLFPEVERVKFADARSASPFGPPPESSAGPVQIPRAKSITLEGPQGTIILTSDDKLPRPAADQVAVPMDPVALAERWELMIPPPSFGTWVESMLSRPLAQWRLSVPVRDRAEPERLKALLAAIPNLWVESFTPPGETALAAASLVGSTDGVKTALASVGVATEKGLDATMLARTELDNPKYKISVQLPGGDVVRLDIGKVSQVKERPGVPPPPRPGMPPMPPMPVREEYRYARLEGQPLVFEIKADKLSDLFPFPTSLRDEKLARFQSKDVNRVDIKLQPASLELLGLTFKRPAATIVLAREKDERKGDKWRILQPEALAESDKVTELLDRLAGLEARDFDIVDQANLKEAGFDPPAGTQITLALEEERPGPGDTKTKQSRTVTLSFGRKEPDAKKVNVRVAGRERVNLVDDAVLQLANRPALAYRGRRVLDFDAAQVARIEVKRPSENFTLQQASGDWKLVVPAPALATVSADKTKAGQLVDDLGRLEAVEYTNDAPTPQDLASAGLDKPDITATVSFADSATKLQTLLVGKLREGKQDYYAKLAGGPSIFVIRKDQRDRLEQGSLDYRPLQLWTLTGDELTDLKVERGAEKYELVREGFNWKVTAPFQAAVGAGQVMPMVDAVAGLKATGYQAHAAANPAEFGLDKPQVRLTFTTIEKGKDGAKDSTRHRTLMLGKAVPGKPEVYAQVSDDPAVFRVAEAVVASANKSALDMLNRQLLTLESRRIAKIERAGGAKWTAVKAGNAWKIQADGVSFAADQPTMAVTLRMWELLQAEKFAAYGPNVKPEEFGLNPPADTLTVTLDAPAGGQPETHTLKLGKPADGGGRYARVDDQPGIAILPAFTAKELARSHLDYAEKTLLSVDPANIQTIRRQMPGSDLELSRKDGWKIVKPSEQKGDEQSLDDLAKDLSILRADRVVAFAPADLKPFGLDKPGATVTIETEENGKATPHVLKIGAPVDAKTPDGDRYAAVEGSKVVGVLARMYAKRLLAEPITFRDRSLVKRLPEPDKVVLERGERAGDKKAVFTKAEGTWKMTAPLAAEAEHAELEEFVNALFKLRADELVAEKPSPEKLREYGLDKPQATWRFLNGDKEVLALVIGKRDSTDQRVYAKLANGDVVFLLEPTVTTRATTEYRKRALWSGFDAAQVESLTIAGEGGPQTLRKVNGMWQVDGKPDVKLKQDAVTETLAALAGLKVERYLVDKDAPLALYGLDKPRRTLTARTSAGMSQELLVGNHEGGSKRVYATVPGHTEVFILSEADTAKVDRDVKSLQEK